MMGINNDIHVLWSIILGLFFMFITMFVSWRKQVKRNDKLYEFNNYILEHLFRNKNNERGNNS